MKVIFDFLTSPLGLPISPIWEYLILMIILIIAYKSAWWFSHGGQLGSLIHWIVRLFTFLILYVIVRSIIWMFANWVLVVSVLGCVLFVVSIIIKHKQSAYKSFLAHIKMITGKDEFV